LIGPANLLCHGWIAFFQGILRASKHLAAPRTKKADMAEHPEVFDHVGLLVNEPHGTAALLFI
jgi:hypothetical protein